jgi:hypothetical protein
MDVAATSSSSSDPMNMFAAAEICAVNMVSAEAFKATVVRQLFSKITMIMTACLDQICERRLDEVRYLLRSASFHTQYVDDLCYIIFVRLLAKMDQQEDGQTVHALNALVRANPKLPSVVDSRGNLILHHLAGSFAFSYFMSRYEDNGCHTPKVKHPNNAYAQFLDADVDVDTYNDNDEDDEALRASVNPFHDVLHQVISSNRAALHHCNQEGLCPIHILCSQPIAGSEFLELLLWYSPSCAHMMVNNNSKYPLHLLMGNINCDREVDITSAHYKCAKLLVDECPHACFHEIEESFTRLNISIGQNSNGNTNNGESRNIQVHRVWSPFSMVAGINGNILGALMTGQLLASALTQQQRFAHSSGTKRRQNNMLRNIIGGAKYYDKNISASQLGFN